MNAIEFALLDLHHRYRYLQARGKKLASFQDTLYLVHIYALDDFYAELKLDPERYNIISVEPFDESHPRHRKYMDHINAVKSQ